MEVHDLNTGTYLITPTAVSTAITLDATIGFKTKAIIKNDTDKAVFCVAGKGSAPTAVFPASASVPVNGKIILAGATEVYSLLRGHTHISVIQKTAGSGDLSLCVGGKN